MNRATKNGITVEYVRSNEVYDIYKVTGLEADNIDEPMYHQEVRYSSNNAEDILLNYDNWKKKNPKIK